MALGIVIGVAVIGGHRPEPVGVVPDPAPVPVAAGPPQVSVAEVGQASLPAVRRGPVILTGQRVHGTDGLMGRLPFGLPGDSPTVYRQREDRFENEPLYPRSNSPLHAGPYVR